MNEKKINYYFGKIFKTKNTKPKSFSYPLLSDGYTDSDLKKAAQVLVSRKLTMGAHTKKFENYFAKKLGAKNCLMVNSGSSANLLALFCLINKKKENRVPSGSECIVPSLCWSTSLWPIVQAGLKPVFLDVDRSNFCLNFSTIKKNVTKKTKVIMLINVLGNCSEIDKIRNFAKRKNIYLIEDNCESLGSKYKNKYLGTFGDFSSFSFYFSHQVTAGEGGMIICKSSSDLKILKSLRAHGWDREIKKNNKFNFINQGFNLRPLEVSAAIGLNQFKKLNYMKKIRAYNRNKIINLIKKSENWNNQFIFFEASKDLDPSWFGLPLILNKKLSSKKNTIINYLNKKRIETRPIISGNFLNRPAAKLYNFKNNKKKFMNSEIIEKRGFFIGLPTQKINPKNLKKLVNFLLKVEKV
jgi:CDP-6-deoxy-D-xylo-4-hexulose-3-dehydrase